MNKLKVRFMLVVLEFIRDWYKILTKDDPNQMQRLIKLTNLRADLEKELE